MLIPMGVLTAASVAVDLFPGLLLVPIAAIQAQLGMEPVAATLSGPLPGLEGWSPVLLSVVTLILATALLPWLRLGHRAGIVRTDFISAASTDAGPKRSGRPLRPAYTRHPMPSSAAPCLPQPRRRRRRGLREADMANSSAILIAVLLFPGGLFALAFGLALKGADRRVAARAPGPDRAAAVQPFFDLVKLGFKRTIAPVVACETVFFGAPLVGTASMLLAVTADPHRGRLQPRSANRQPSGPALSAGHPRRRPHDRRLCLRIALRRHRLLRGNGADARLRGTDRARCHRRGAAHRARRGTFPTFSLAEIVQYQQTHGAFILDPVMWPAVAAFAFFYPANLGIVPFDIPEAETEVLEGPLLEYSGPALALFKVMSALKAVVVLGLGVALFMPLPLTGGVGLAAWMGQQLVLVLIGVTAVRVSRGRMRIDQAFVFFLKWPLLLSAVSLAAVAYYTAGGAIMSVLAKLKDFASRSPWLYRINAGSMQRLRCRACHDSPHSALRCRAPGHPILRQPPPRRHRADHRAVDQARS